LSGTAKQHFQRQRRAKWNMVSDRLTAHTKKTKEKEKNESH
jgi:hypothetical protein